MRQVSNSQFTQDGAIAIIPARGGSKRLTRKNLALLDGRPLVAHSIQYALEEPLIRHAFVSTEDPEIAAVASTYGCDVIPRPENLADDMTSTAAVLKHALEWLTGQGLDTAPVATLQPTCPIRPQELFSQAWTAFLEHHADLDSLITVSPVAKKMGELKDGAYWPDVPPGQRSQDLSQRFAENGVLYLTKPEVLIEQASVFGRRIFPFIMAKVFNSLDIDDEGDLQLVRLLFPSLAEGSIGAFGPRSATAASEGAAIFRGDLPHS